MFSGGFIAMQNQISSDEKMGGAIVAIGVGLFFVPIWIITGPTLHLCLRFKKFIISQQINKGKIEDLISTKVKKIERLVSSKIKSSR